MHYMQWIPVSERLPLHELEEYREEYGENPEFIALIQSGSVPTCLSFDGEGFYSDADVYGDGDHEYYLVTHWMRMPPMPEECRVIDDFGEFSAQYETLEVLFR